MSHPTVLTDTHIGSAYTVEEAREQILRKIMRRVRILENGCWEWTGSKNRKGYGQTNVCGEKWTVTRLMLTIHVRRLESQELACHKCDWPPCCNPDHLYIGDKHINAIDKVQAGTNHYNRKTHCPKGHSYAEHGYIHAGRGGATQWRSCKLCQRISQRLRAGWPKELAETLGKTQPGLRPVNARFHSIRTEGKP